jgi:hypothetical protein
MDMINVFCSPQCPARGGIKMQTIWPDDRRPAEDVGPRTIEEIKRLFPARNASSVSDEQAFYMLMPDGFLIGDEVEGRGHFNHSVILGSENYENQTEFYKQHGALRVDINEYLYVDVMFALTDSQRLAIGQMYRKIGYHEMTWQIAWLPDRTKRTEGTLQQFFQALDEALNEMARERVTMSQIREVLKTGQLREPFRAKDVNRAIGITFAGVFLPKHRVGNPGMKGRKNTEHFIQVSRGLYRLKNPN